MIMNQRQIMCPQCGTPLQARIQQLVDARRDPTAKARLLSGTLNRIHCPTCGFEGSIAAPLVYHDPENELLLTYMPMEAGLNKDEQEKIIGGLINRVVESLPPEERKGYLFQPQSVLTLQGLIERVLETEGISKEDLEAQREKMRLFEEFLSIPDEHLKPFVEQHDEQLDATFFQIASLALQSARDPKAREAAASRLERAIEWSTFGQRLKAQERELKLATQSLQALSEKGLTREGLLDLFLQAPNHERVVALVNLTRPALDYLFFQQLSERIDAAAGEEKQRLETLRGQILEVTQEIDQMQQARAAQAASLLRSLIEAPNLDEALRQAIPLIDDLFLGTLQANLQVAEERGDGETLERLRQIDQRLRAILRDSLPPGLRFVQQILEQEDPQAAEGILRAEPERIDEEVLNSLMATAQRLEDAGDTESAQRIRDLYKLALKLSMGAKMEGAKS